MILQVDPSGQTLITGYSDGVMRVLVLQQLDHTSLHDHRKTMSLSPARSGMTISSNLTLAHVCKPHKSSLSCLAVDSQGLLLATGVSSYYYYHHTINRLYRELIVQYSSLVLRTIMNQLDSLILLHLLPSYSGLLQYVIMSLFVCNYVYYACVNRHSWRV